MRVEVDLAAFVRTDQHDISTSAIVALLVDEEADIRRRWIRVATDLATPAMLVALPERLSLWSIAADESDSHELASSSITSPTEVITRLSVLTPEAVARAKACG